jgi:hypothetical protein
MYPGKGDHIKIQTDFKGIPFDHHGISCGDGYVVHFCKKADAIVEIPLTRFANGRKIYIINYPVSFTTDEIVAHARSLVGTGRYDLLFNNCEHIVYKCRTGEPHSMQVKTVARIIDAGVQNGNPIASLAGRALSVYSIYKVGLTIWESTQNEKPSGFTIPEPLSEEANTRQSRYMLEPV